jgi:ABC-type transport system involved in multi-copper enzyme maturation permease subunit
MIPTVFPVATLTLRDLVRRRVFATLGLFTLLMILLSFPLRQLTIGQWTRLITDIGFGATDLCATLLAIFLGATLISGDLDRRTLYPLLAKPISHASFVVGKFLGLATVLLSLTAIMSLGILAMLKLALMSLAREQPALLVSLFQTATAIALHACVCGGIALFFSCFTSTTLAATFSLGLTFLGHTVDSLTYFATKSSSLEGDVVRIAARLLPNLERLNLKTLAAQGQTIPWNDLGLRAIYGLAYTAAAIALGAAIFSRRDLK